MATDLAANNVRYGAGKIGGAKVRRTLAHISAAMTVLAFGQFAVGTAAAQTSAPPAAASASPLVLPTDMTPVPFGVGEKLEYDVKFSSVKVGTGSMEVTEIVPIRDQPSWHTVFNVQGRALVWFNLKIMLESWFDVVSLSSRRYHQDQKYTGYSKNLTTEIFPERGMFKEEGKEERVTVAKPLDDGSFLYYVRTIPLVVGETYTLSQYYKPEANPVTIHVDRREKITVPAGTFNTIVLQPKIKTKSGIFGQDGKAEVWLTDDSTHMMVQLKSDLSIGSINLYLNKFKLGSVVKPQSP